MRARFNTIYLLWEVVGVALTTTEDELPAQLGLGVIVIPVAPKGLFTRTTVLGQLADV